MAVVSARVNDKSKAEAEKIAGEIGISLSSAINIFLNRFIAEKGFPFQVTSPKKESALFGKEHPETIVAQAIKNNSPAAGFPKSAYIDPDDNTLKHTL